MADKQPERGFSKVCYYELLEVDRKADKNTIKKVLDNHCSYLNFVGFL